MFATIKKRLPVLLQKINSLRRDKPLVFWSRTLVITGVALLFITRRTFWTPDTLFIALLAVFFVLGQARAFVVRFAPFVLLLVAYDSFRSIADDLNNYVNFWPMIDFDRAVFGGQLPTTTLQQWWWHGSLQWYDFYFYFLYTLHFVVPVALAVIIWKLRPALYWQFVIALVGLSFAAFITYIVYPAAPPWMASEMGLIEPLRKISTDIWYAMGIQDASNVYKSLSPNLVAAVPSLHSAYPLLFVMFAWKLFTFKKTWWLAFYPVSMWIGVVYLGEHYVIDALLGALYAVLAYYAAVKIMAWIRAYAPTFTKDYKVGYKKGSAIANKTRS